MIFIFKYCITSFPFNININRNIYCCCWCSKYIIIYNSSCIWKLLRMICCCYCSCSCPVTIYCRISCSWYSLQISISAWTWINKLYNIIIFIRYCPFKSYRTCNTIVRRIARVIKFIISTWKIGMNNCRCRSLYYTWLCRCQRKRNTWVSVSKYK